jgi:DNA invertase Pin-like site-specific DNA recombinase
MKIKITIELKIPLYQKFASKIRELKALEMTKNQIARRLNISRKTVQNGITKYISIKKPFN